MGRISDLVEELQGPANDLVLAAGRAASFPASQARSVQTLSNGDCTLVFWPERQATPSRPQATAHTNTAWLSIWWSRRWKRLRMSATRGNSGAAVGTPPMPYTSSSPEQANTPASKDGF